MFVGRNIKIFFARCRLYVANKWSQARGFFVRLKLPRWMQSRRALLAGYVAVMAVLAGVWWVNSPYRLRNITENPPVQGEQPVDEQEAVLTDPPARQDDEPPSMFNEPETPEQELTADLEESIPVMASPPLIISSLIKPVKGPVALKYGFSWSETYGDFRWHHGVGLGSTQGTPVLAAYAGTVKDIVSGCPELSTKVIVEHGSGWETIYASISKVSVQKGQKVSEGQQLGQVGPNPPASSKAQSLLYFALYRDGESQNPTELFK